MFKMYIIIAQNYLELILSYIIFYFMYNIITLI